MAWLRGPPKGGIWVLYQDLISPQGMKAESEKGLQQVFFYRAVGETEELNLEERKEMRRHVVSQSAFFKAQILIIIPLDVISACTYFLG